MRHHQTGNAACGKCQRYYIILLYILYDGTWFASTAGRRINRKGLIYNIYIYVYDAMEHRRVQCVSVDVIADRIRAFSPFRRCRRLVIYITRHLGETSGGRSCEFIIQRPAGQFFYFQFIAYFQRVVCASSERSNRCNDFV